MENSLRIPDHEKHGFAGQKTGEVLSFYGTVKQHDAVAVEGAVVMVFACFAGGIERALGCTFTDREGAYFVCIPKLPDDTGLTGFKVRAGKACTLVEGFNHPDNYKEEACKELREGIVQEEHSEEECVPGQEKILDEEKVSTQAEGQNVGPIHVDEVGESEYQRRPDPEQTQTDVYSLEPLDSPVFPGPVDLNPPEGVISAEHTGLPYNEEMEINSDLYAVEIPAEVERNMMVTYIGLSPASLALTEKGIVNIKAPVREATGMYQKIWLSCIVSFLVGVGISGFSHPKKRF